MKLVVVESPTKAKTLSKILDKSYIIEASMGHIRDLPKKGLGVDLENDYTPAYEIPDRSKKTVTALKKALKDANEVILATDPDREGEAIAWHLHYILSTSKAGKKLPYKRVVFHELTKEAVLEAFSHPSEVNLHLVDSQQARRILDRLVGYKLSPLLWKKVQFGLSAGRVQSVAVRLVVEKERERDAFNSEEYWSITSNFSPERAKDANFDATLEKYKDKKIKITSEEESTKILEDLKEDTYKVSSVTKTERAKKPYAPFKTSTLQQAMANVYGLSANKTMSAAQKLFEQGFITYHRTDSLSMAPNFIQSVREHVKKTYGNEYLPKDPIFYKTKSKGAQEAHEAVRPTELTLHPADKKITKLGTDAQRVYSLLWKRSLECQMSSAVYDQTTVLIDSSSSYQFKANGSIIKFDGWLVIGNDFKDEDEENLGVLPDLNEGEPLLCNQTTPKQHFTQPPARYSDASLIKTLEELGIGRPSTYAPTITTIQGRGYVQKEGRYFSPKDVAYVVTDLLVEHFSTISDYEFTAKMEEQFDEIAAGTKNWVPVIKDFYEPFEKKLEIKDKELNKRDVTNLGETDEVCPECSKGKLIIKLGKYGKFLSCANYPECEFARPMDNSDAVDENGEAKDFGKCPNCEEGTFTLKQGRFGKFLACTNYPKCKTTQPFLDKIGMACPKCENGEVIVKKAKGRTFFGCSKYPECDYASWKNPLPKAAQDQDES